MNASVVALDDIEPPKAVETCLRLGGISCAACAQPIELALRSVPGVLSVAVATAVATAVVRWDPAHTNVAALVDAIQRAGYDAAPHDAQGLGAWRQHASRQLLWRWFVAAFCGMQVMMFLTPTYVAEPDALTNEMRRLLLWGAWTLTLPVMAFSAQPYWASAWRALWQRRMVMEVPVALGLVITLVASTAAMVDPNGPWGDAVYFDSLTMFVTFLLSARWLEMRLRHRAAEGLEGAMAALPDVARRLRDDGAVEEVSIRALRPGDAVQVRLGDAFGADGVIEHGTTWVDEALLTGEARPIEKTPGDPVVAGSLNRGHVVVMRVHAVGVDTRQAAIVSLVHGAMTSRPTAARWADRWAGPFLVGVVALAGLAGAFWLVVAPERAVWVMVSMLVVTCPCALSLAVPSSLLAAAGNLARRGVLVRHLDAIETLSRVQVVMMDKTGTLTEPPNGRMTLVRLSGPVDVTAQALDAQTDEPANAWAMHRMVDLAAQSSHPLSRAVVASQGATEPRGVAWRGVHEVAGQGVEGTDLDGRVWRLGAAAWAWPGGQPSPGARVVGACEGVGAWAWVDDETQPEVLRPGVEAALAALRTQSIRVVLLSGDAPARVQGLADRLGLDEAVGAASPEGKLRVMREAQRAGLVVAMVGDGINDAPVLAQADVSLAMGDGAWMAQSQADFVLLNDGLTPLVHALPLARRCDRNVRQNVRWAVAYNLACVPMAAMGWLPPWAAGVGMALSSLAVMANAQRLSR